MHTIVGEAAEVNKRTFNKLCFFVFLYASTILHLTAGYIFQYQNKYSK